LRLKEKINTILTKHSGQPLEVIERDTERDFYMDGSAAQDYGIIDHVLLPAARTEKAEAK
jgi:ATP-dependent Clp protease protease subunit